MNLDNVTISDENGVHVIDLSRVPNLYEQEMLDLVVSTYSNYNRPVSFILPPQGTSSHLEVDLYNYLANHNYDSTVRYSEVKNTEVATISEIEEIRMKKLMGAKLTIREKIIMLFKGKK